MPVHDLELGTGAVRGRLLPDRAGELERYIERRAGGRIYDLRVDCSGERVILYGRCRTYHAKQLAQEAALDLIGEPGRVVNQIVVS